MDDAPLNNNSLTVGRVLRISELQLREGMNDVMLTVMRSDGTSQDINYSVNIEREEITLPPVGMLHTVSIHAIIRGWFMALHSCMFCA